MTKIYLASPFFDDEQVQRIEKVEKALRSNSTVKDVFSPREHQHDEYEFATRKWGEVVYAADIEALEDAEGVVAVVDYVGEEVDPGTAMEIGYAVHKGTPVIILQEKDTRANIMWAMPLRAYFKNPEELATYDFNELPENDYSGDLI
jgi:nucleoside deoxyribosyltransferase